MTITENDLMKITLSFIPDTIVALRTIRYHSSEIEQTLPYKIWGDQVLWDCCKEYFTTKVKGMKPCILFIQKNTLKWHVIEFEVNKDVENIPKT